MQKSELRSRLKKPLIMLLTALVVFVVSVFAISGITAHAQAVVNNDAQGQTQDGILTQQDQGFLSDLLDVNDSGGTLELVLLITILSLAPSLLILMTCFTRIIIVFSLLRSAMGTQQTPPNQVLVGLALFLTFFIMSPVFSQINTVAYEPYKAGEYSAIDAAKKASVPLKEFMLKNTQVDSMQFFLDLSGTEMPQEDIAENLGLHIVVPAFIVSELKRAFIIGFLLFIPFLIIDIIVSSTLMSMGMIMLPPAMIALPFKILLFIIVDGWHLLIGTLAAGFNV